MEILFTEKTWKVKPPPSEKRSFHLYTRHHFACLTTLNDTKVQRKSIRELISFSKTKTRIVNRVKVNLNNHVLAGTKFIIVYKNDQTQIQVDVTVTWYFPTFEKWYWVTSEWSLWEGVELPTVFGVIPLVLCLLPEETTSGRSRHPSRGSTGFLQVVET
jgi:hypothetical protein